MSEQEEELQKLEEELAETKGLLSYTRNYADRLMEELHLRVEEIQRTKDLLIEKNSMLTNSIECARHVLRTVRNPQQELARLYKDSFSIFIPRDVIGGDFFWVHELPDMRLIAVADCTGHGVAGAMVSMMAEMMLKQAVVEMQMRDPSSILETLDAMIKANAVLQPDTLAPRSASDISIDMLVAQHLPKQGLWRIASAHMPFFYTSEGRIVRVKGERHGVGFSNRQGVAKAFAMHELQLAKGDMIYFSSDGLIDQHREASGQRLGNTLLSATLERLCHLPSQTQERELERIFFEWKGFSPQTDDIMVLGIRN